MRFRLFPLLLTLSFEAAAAVEFSSKINDIEFYGSGTNCAAILTIADDFGVKVMGIPNSKLKPVSELSPPDREMITLKPQNDRDFQVHLPPGVKVILSPAEESKAEILVYSSDSKKAVKASDLILSRTTQEGLFVSRPEVEAPNVLQKFVAKFITSNDACLMTLRDGEVESVYGVCIVIQVHLSSADRIKVYKDGSYIGKSPLATLLFADVESVLDNWNSSQMRVLEEYTGQPSVTSISKGQLIKVVGGIPNSSNQVEAITIMAAKVDGVDAPSLVEILEHISSSSSQVEAVRTLKEKVNLARGELASVLETVSSSSAQTQIVELLGTSGRNAEPGSGYSGHDLALAIASISSDSSKVQAIRALAPHTDAVTAGELKAIFEDIASDSSKVEVARILQSKLSLQDSQLAELLAPISSDSQKRETISVLLENLKSFNGACLSGVAEQISSDPIKMDVLRMLAPKVDQLSANTLGSTIEAFSSESRQVEVLGLFIHKLSEKEKLDMEEFVDDNFSGSKLRTAREILRGRRTSP